MRTIIVILFFGFSFMSFGQISTSGKQISDMKTDSIYKKTPQVIFLFGEQKVKDDAGVGLLEKIKPKWIKKIKVLKENNNLHGNNQPVILIFIKRKYIKKFKILLEQAGYI